MTVDRTLEDAVAMHRKGELGDAVRCYRLILQRSPQDPEALHYCGLAYLQLGDLPMAEKLMAESLRLRPDNANALCDLGTLRARQERYTDAVPLFDRALQLNANHTDALNNLGTTLLAAGQPAKALPHLERLKRLQPNSAPVARRLGGIHVRLRNLDAAIYSYQLAVALDPEDSQARLSLGDIYESAGRFKEARLQYVAVLRRAEDAPMAIARLLLLPVGPVEPAWVSRAQDLARNPLTPPDGRTRLHLALAHYFDRNRDYENAFAVLKLANDVLSTKYPFDSDGFTDAIDHLIDVFSMDFFRRPAEPRCPLSDRPIFIVGMPRSGTTLTEQILASHPHVAAGGELSALMEAGAQVAQLTRSGRPYPDGLADLEDSDLLALAQRYLRALDRISASARYVTDKLPFNFMHLGLIGVLFPNASIIHCVRHPLDTCLSCYFTNFSENIQFASNLTTLGRYYSDYTKLMRHWSAVLPLRILEVRYESLVSRTEPVVRKILDHCGLQWDSRCLAFFETERHIRTPSRWQVRQPIYSASIGRWQHYAHHLGPVRAALGDALETAV